MKYALKGNYFNGQWNQPITTGPDATEIKMNRSCPADLETPLWECPVDYRHVEPVVESAYEGFKKWRQTSLDERKNCLKQFQEQVISIKDQMAEAISLETGKPLWEALTEASAVIAKVDVTLNDSLNRINPRLIENILPETNGHIYYKPIGPCFIIGPFNFPCHLANGQILSALIAGNSIIFKPSEKTCYSAQLLIDCLSKANFPKGVINLVQGDGEIARRILNEKAVKGVFFTGSKEIGLKILKSTHHDLTKLVSLELGGKNAAIIHKDANFEHALSEIIKGAFLTTGQRCTSTAIVPIHRSLLDEFIDKFHQVAKNIIIDHPIQFEDEPFMGPLVDQQSIDNYLLFMGMAKREGIDEVMRGKQIEKKFRGHYVSPSIHLSQKFEASSHFLSSEIFGPNCTFIPYDDIEEAIQISNSTEYGLAASIFTKEKSIYEKCLNEMDAGLINLNRSTVGASSKLPFGGVKNSGNYHPAAVTTIDSCVYQLASLEFLNNESDSIENQKGIKK